MTLHFKGRLPVKFIDIARDGRIWVQLPNGHTFRATRAELSRTPRKCRALQHLTSATVPTPGTAVPPPTATAAGGNHPVSQAPSTPQDRWLPSKQDPELRARYALEDRLQDELREAWTAQDARDVRGLAKLFSPDAWQALRIKIALFLHGFPVPRRSRRVDQWLEAKREECLRQRIQQARCKRKQPPSVFRGNDSFLPSCEKGHPKSTAR